MYPSVCQPVYLSVCNFVSFTVCLSVCLLTHMTATRQAATDRAERVCVCVHGRQPCTQTRSEGETDRQTDRQTDRDRAIKSSFVAKFRSRHCILTKPMPPLQLIDYLHCVCPCCTGRIRSCIEHTASWPSSLWNTFCKCQVATRLTGTWPPPRNATTAGRRELISRRQQRVKYLKSAPPTAHSRICAPLTFSELARRLQRSTHTRCLAVASWKLCGLLLFCSR